MTQHLRFSRYCSAAVLLAVILLSTHSLAQGFLHASGTSIVDRNGSPILLRGMGLGGWLVPEGYMLGTSSFANSPTAIRMKVVQTVGTVSADQFFSLYRQKFVQRKDIDSLAHWGFNSVRLPMHYGLLSSAPGVYLESGFATIDSLLDWCSADSIYLILDLHCAPGGQNLDNISDYQGYPSLWESQDDQQWTAEIWKTLAARYAGQSWIGGYDLLNEPAFTFPSGNGPLRELYVRITDSIRSVDTHHLIFAEGNWYATDFSSLPPAWDNNMAWSFHKYWNPPDNASLGSYVNLRGTTGAPLWMGESGENSNEWFSEALTWLELNKIGWSWWTLKKIESISCPLSVRKSVAFDALLKYWGGSGPALTVAEASSALLGEAMLFEADSCRLRPDYLDALFRVHGSTERTPYADNSLPGSIDAVNYDIGRLRSSYYDADYWNTGSGDYNKGWSYRNDGVDIEACSDPSSNGFDVGWISGGEYLAYTVRIQTGGVYHLQVRAASGASGGSLNFTLDGSDLTGTIAIPATGGWQNWQNVDGGEFHGDAGTHSLVANFLSDGFNVNRFDFTLVAEGVAASAGLRGEYQLEQNTPNPFNPTTVIGFTLPSAGDALLTIYNSLGETVARPVSGRLERGRHEVVVDGSRMPSGVYFYRLQAAHWSAVKKMLIIR